MLCFVCTIRQRKGKYILTSKCLHEGVVVLKETKTYIGGWVMNDFLSWCIHLLVPFLFHDLTSLHPPSFNFSTCSTNVFHSGAKPQQKCDMFGVGSFNSWCGHVQV